MLALDIVNAVIHVLAVFYLEQHDLVCLPMLKDYVVLFHGNEVG